ncbi:hypothetical protein [Methylomicrobium sp. Wu6]|uniref:hypothetical protein n=1 Tax=Methylomicrobium sp. Wu6 TaxID=3107928 RepID=UPI002DD63649|nr:hypothetical protein [Methylomicrobium sp. Wu6]MEC4750612.1 hypothetical protein [Methylomicrobium sp. Wu6]
MEERNNNPIPRVQFIGSIFDAKPAYQATKSHRLYPQGDRQAAANRLKSAWDIDFYRVLNTQKNGGWASGIPYGKSYDLRDGLKKKVKKAVYALKQGFLLDFLQLSRNYCAIVAKNRQA